MIYLFLPFLTSAKFGPYKEINHILVAYCCHILNSLIKIHFNEVQSSSKAQLSDYGLTGNHTHVRIFSQEFLSFGKVIPLHETSTKEACRPWMVWREHSERSGHLVRTTSHLRRSAPTQDWSVAAHSVHQHGWEGQLS